MAQSAVRVDDDAFGWEHPESVIQASLDHLCGLNVPRLHIDHAHADSELGWTLSQKRKVL